MKRKVFYAMMFAALFIFAVINTGGCGGSSHSSGDSGTASNDVAPNPNSNDVNQNPASGDIDIKSGDYGSDDWEDPVFETLSGQWSLEQYNIQVIYKFLMNLYGTHEADKSTISYPGL